MATLRQLSYFLAVVDEGSFSRAATRMHVAQPSLSQQIRALENELGGALLERLPRSVRLTVAGRAFLPHAEASVRAADRGVSAARSALNLQTGELTISTVSSIASGLLPDLVRRWLTFYPETSIHLREHSHRESAENAVREGQCEIGIGPRPKHWTGPIESLGWEEFVVVLPDGHPLSDNSQISLSQLADCRWVLFHDNHGLSDLIARACAAIDPAFSPQAAVLTSQVEAAARLAAAGAGPTLVPSNSVPPGLAGVVLPTWPRIGRELTVYGRGQWSGLRAAFTELIVGLSWPDIPDNAQDVG